MFIHDSIVNNLIAKSLFFYSRVDSLCIYLYNTRLIQMKKLRGETKGLHKLVVFEIIWRQERAESIVGRQVGRGGCGC